VDPLCTGCQLFIGHLFNLAAQNEFLYCQADFFTDFPRHQIETLFNGSTQINDSSPLRISLEHDSSFEFETTVSANAKQQLNIDIRNWNGEKVTIGYNWDKQQLFIDRGDTRGFENPYFTNDFSSFLAPPNGQFKLHALVDRSIVELYVNDGERVATTVFFMEKPASELVFGAKNGSVAVQDLRVYSLKSIWR
jgi:sucrose-6-phosphate hydrolase SacC (GH32 family)